MTTSDQIKAIRAKINKCLKQWEPPSGEPLSIVKFGNSTCPIHKPAISPQSSLHTLLAVVADCERELAKSKQTQHAEGVRGQCRCTVLIIAEALEVKL